MAQKISQELLKDLRGKLLLTKAKIEAQVEGLKKDDPFADPDHASDNAAVDTDVREEVGHETIEAQIKDLQIKLENIDMALRKITKGKYGICERCGKTIPIARLKILPEALYCVDCEEKLRK